MCRSTLFRLRLRTHSLTIPRSPIPTVRTFLLIYSTELAFLLHLHGGRARGETVLRREIDTEKAPEKARVI